MQCFRVVQYAFSISMGYFLHCKYCLIIKYKEKSDLVLFAVHFF
jgi:hypothetical protein